MEQSVKKFLEFNGKAIFFLAKSGQYWIAVKPICEALGIDYNRQFQNLKKHPAFSQLFAKQQMTGSDGKLYKMIALQEKHIYGWLFNVRSDSADLIKYQLECCNILYDYFHGSITSRETLIKEKTKEQIEEERLEALLANNPDYNRLLQIKRKVKTINTQLRELDTVIQKDQLELFKL